MPPFLLAAATLLPILAPAIAYGYQQDPPPRADREAKVVELAAPILDQKLAPGMVIGILEGGDRSVIPLGSLTYDRGEAPSASTVYEIGSISKVFTALLLADAEHRGELSERDPLFEHLPEGVEIGVADPDNPIRLVHLATHASGLPRMPSNLEPPEFMNPFKGYDRERLWAFLEGHNPGRAPEERYEYSNLASGLLGTVLADSVGVTYGRLLADRVAGPLGLTDTSIVLSEGQASRLAPPFRKTTPNRNWEFDALAGCGAVRSTVSDLLSLAEFSLDALGEEGLPESVPESLDEALGSVQVLRFSPGLSDPDVALGWHLAGPENKIVWHNGGTGGYSTFLGLNTANDTAVVILANGSTQEITRLGFRLLRELGEP